MASKRQALAREAIQRLGLEVGDYHQEVMIVRRAGELYAIKLEGDGPMGIPTGVR